MKDIEVTFKNVGTNSFRGVILAELFKNGPGDAAMKLQELETVRVVNLRKVHPHPEGIAAFMEDLVAWARQYRHVNIVFEVRP